MGAALQRMLSSFYTRQLEVVLVGLENSGKTTLMNVLANGHPVDTVPTIGLNVKMIKRGGVQMKCWDIGGQAQYRSEWGRYTRGCDVIVYVVDAHAEEKTALARRELHRLLEDQELASTPLLVLANKIDLEPHMAEEQIIRELNLDYVTANPWIMIPISARKVINIDQAAPDHRAAGGFSVVNAIGITRLDKVGTSPMAFAKIVAGKAAMGSGVPKTSTIFSLDAENGWADAGRDGMAERFEDTAPTDHPKVQPSRKGRVVNGHTTKARNK